MEDTPNVLLQDPRVADLTSWLVNAGVLGMQRTAMLEAYCHKLIALNVPLLRCHVTHNAVHPIYGAVGFDWQQDAGPAHHQYAHSNEAPQNWFTSPFYHMLSNGLAEFRETIWDATAPSQFPLIEDMKPKGATDYFALAILFEDWDEGQPVDPDANHDGAIMSWMSNAPEGFSDTDLDLIRATFPTLALVLKARTYQKTAEDLLGIYLGRDAGRRVLSGEIQRGSSRWINAVVCYFDFEGFTSLSQQLEGEELIGMLNDYFALVVHEIEAEGGNVLKFMGDGLLAIFDREQLMDAPDRAMRAVRAMSSEIAALSAHRDTQGMPVFNYTIALHAGRVLYGNIGAEERLDFTVIGPEVNLAARIGGMHKSLGQSVILSGTLAKKITDPSCDLVSLGRYMLRGVAQPQELFTIHGLTQETSLDPKK